jgi:hypothetical protein
LAFAQLGQATGDEFTILAFHDVHYNDAAGVWQNSVNWLLGASGRGPGGVSGISYYNIKSINGVGDYDSPCTGAGSACDIAWGGFKSIWDTLYAGYSALGIKGIWTQGNHDTYGYAFGSMAGVSVGANPSWQSTTLDVSGTSQGTIRLGIVGVGVGDYMASGQPARAFVDGVIAGSDAHRQWMFLRHVGPAEPYGDYTPRVTPPCGDPATNACTSNVGIWCDACAGWGGTNSALSLLSDFFYTVTRVFWFATGHYSYGAAMVQVTANDGHLISGIGNNGNDGAEGHVTMFKFQPASSHVQIAHYTIGVAGTPAGALVGSVQTVAWAVEGTAASGLLWSPCPVGR